MITIKAPAFPESVSDGQVAHWNVRVGEHVERDSVVCEIETEKVVLEVLAPASGQLSNVMAQTGDVVLSNAAIGEIDDTIQQAKGSDGASAASGQAESESSKPQDQGSHRAGPAARRAAQEAGVSVAQVTPSGPRGLVTKPDVLSMGADRQSDHIREPMSRLRQTIARRLTEVQRETASLTTFNDVDMTEVMRLRAQYKDMFEKTHGVRLGFMSFFVKAVVEALKRYPVFNASIDGTDVVYHRRFHIGVAVSTPRGLVVPVIRDADQLTMAEIESTVRDFGSRAQTGKLDLSEMEGATFTLTNGGTFGSLLSTPILNSPQTGILGMHRIDERPVVVDGAIVARPMMYLAVTYDHRLVDGRDAVQYLGAIKGFIEDPAAAILQV